VLTLIALTIAVYAVYIVWRGISDPAWSFIPYGLLGVVTAAGLARRRRWAEPLTYAFLGLVAGTWIALAAAAATIRRPSVVELVPGVLLLVVCAASAVVVFRRFHPRA